MPVILSTARHVDCNCIILQTTRTTSAAIVLESALPCAQEPESSGSCSLARPQTVGRCRNDGRRAKSLELARNEVISEQSHDDIIAVIHQGYHLPFPRINTLIRASGLSITVPIGLVPGTSSISLSTHCAVALPSSSSSESHS